MGSCYALLTNFVTIFVSAVFNVVLCTLTAAALCSSKCNHLNISLIITNIRHYNYSYCELLLNSANKYVPPQHVTSAFDTTLC